MRASPLLAYFANAAYEFGPCGDMSVALAARDAREAATYLADLSGLRKYLLAGSGAAAWLRSQALPVPPWWQRAARDDGCWVARVGAARYLISEGPRAAGALSIEPGRLAEDTLVLTLDSVEIVLGGTQAATVLAEFCAVDLRECAAGQWLAVLCAQIEIGLYVEARSADREFHLVCAPADAGALFHVLTAALRAAHGAVIGFADYQAKIRRGSVE